MVNKKKQKSSAVIAVNRKARHDYHIQDTLEAGLVLLGWEVKSLRDFRVQLKESYVHLKGGEAYLTGMHVSPRAEACTHVMPDPTRVRKLLLHERELKRLCADVQQKGVTVVPLDLHWKKNRVKVQLGVAQGKKMHDKRESIKQKDLQREQNRELRRGR